MPATVVDHVVPVVKGMKNSRATQGSRRSTVRVKKTMKTRTLLVKELLVVVSEDASPEVIARDTSTAPVATPTEKKFPWTSHPLTDLSIRTEVTNSGPAELAVPHATECEDAAGAAVALADITDAVVAVAHDPTVTARTPAKAAWSTRTEAARVNHATAAAATAPAPTEDAEVAAAEDAAEAVPVPMATMSKERWTCKQ